MATTRSALEFADWLRINHPKLFRQASIRADIAMELRSQQNQANGLGVHPADVDLSVSQSGSWVDTFMQVAGGLGATYLSLDAQKRQLKINIERAQIGLPPIDVAGSPVLTTEVQLDAATVSKITQSAGLQINKLLLFAGAGLAIFFFMRR